MIIDCHVHLLPKSVREDRTPYILSDPSFGNLYSSPKARLASPTDIIEYMDRSEIHKSVVFGFPWEDPLQVVRNNDEVWDFHESYPDRIVPFAVLSTSGGDKAAREAERTVSSGFAGLGELAVYDRGWSSSDFDALGPSIKIAEIAGVPVMIHVNEPVGHEYHGKIQVDFRALMQLLQTNPNVDFILAHFGGGVFIYALMPELAPAFARTYFDTAASPFLYKAKIYDIAAGILGRDKIIFGSDFPLLPISRYLREFEKSGIEPDLRKAILGQNMLKILARRQFTA